MEKGEVFVTHIPKDEESSRKRKDMMLRIVSCSNKLKDHVENCENGNKDCEICDKLPLIAMVSIFMEENFNLKIEDIVDDLGVEEVFFSNDFLKILG